MLSSRNSSTWSRVVVNAFGNRPSVTALAISVAPAMALETPNGRPISPRRRSTMRSTSLHRLAQGHDFGAAEFVGLPGLGRPVEGASGRERHVAREDRLQPRLPAAEQRQHGHEARERGEAVEEFVFGSKDDRRAQHDGVWKFRPRGLLAAALARDVGIGGSGIRADAGDLHQRAHPGGAGGARDFTGAGHMHGFVALRPALALDAGGVDDDVGAIDRRRDRFGIAQIGLHRLDLSDRTLRSEEPRQIRAPVRGADAPALARQSANDMPADEAGAAEDGGEAVAGIGHFSHRDFTFAMRQFSPLHKRRRSGCIGDRASKDARLSTGYGAG